MTKFVAYPSHALRIVAAGNTAQEAVEKAQTLLGLEDADTLEAHPATNRLYAHVMALGSPFYWVERDGLLDIE